jgi:hypothetical protein
MLDEKDVAILDEIIDKLISGNKEITYEDYFDHEFFKDTNNVKLEFQRLIDIISKHECAKVNGGFYNSLSPNHNTNNFKEKGGFKAKYQIQIELAQEESELNSLKKENIILQNRLTKIQTKHANRYIMYAVIGFISGVISSNYKDILQFLQNINQ